MTDGELRGLDGGPDSVGPLPVDLVVVAGLVVLADLVVLVPVLNESVVRVVVGLPAVLVLPGYAVVAALFPERPRPAGPTTSGDDAGGADSQRQGVDGIERAALSVALSIPVVSLAGLGLSLTPLGVTLAPILVTLNALTLGATAVAARRRAQLPESRRFRVPYRAWLAAGRGAIRQPDGRADLVVNVVLAASVLLALGSVTYAIAAPNQGEAFTEFYLLTENESGDLVADDYPTEFTVGDARPIVVGVENHEHRSVEYTVVAQLQRVRIEGNETTVVERDRLDRFSVTLADNETWQERRPIEPTMAGERLRVAYLLYRGAPPEEPSVANAYRDLGLWVTVRDNATGERQSTTQVTPRSGLPADGDRPATTGCNDSLNVDPAGLNGRLN